MSGYIARSHITVYSLLVFTLQNVSRYINVLHGVAWIQNQNWSDYLQTKTHPTGIIYEVSCEEQKNMEQSDISSDVSILQDI